jgi:hypothetical protein
LNRGTLPSALAFAVGLLSVNGAVKAQQAVSLAASRAPQPADASTVQDPAPQAAFSPLDQLNKHLPHWLQFSGEYRARPEGFTGGGLKLGNNDAYFLNRIRLNVNLQPREWLKVVVQAQDARAWGKNQSPAAPPYEDVMDLRLGYLEVGDAEKRTLAIRLGRQELNFGEQRLVGSADWLNTARSFDAVRATLHRPGYRLDAFAASVVIQRNRQFDQSTAGNNLYGLYGTLERLIPSANLQPYLFSRRAPHMLTESKTYGQLDFATVGLRWVGTLPAHFDYATEMALQAGSLGSDNIRAWAGHWLAAYTLARARAKPRIVAEFNHASGDRNPADGRRGTFDQLYPTNHDKYGLTDQVGWKNLNHVRSRLELRPTSKWLAVFSYQSFWLADTHDGFYNAAGVLVARAVNGSAGRYLGQEVDVQATYTFSHRASAGSGYGYLLPGTFLKKTTPGHPYSYPYAFFSYSF